MVHLVYLQLTMLPLDMTALMARTAAILAGFQTNFIQLFNHSPQSDTLNLAPQLHIPCALHPYIQFHILVYVADTGSKHLQHNLKSTS